MSETKVYSIEVQGDFISKQTRAKPAHALAELIWNALDADATLIEIKQESPNSLTSRIIIEDNGTAFSHSEAPVLFSSLGGSWKRLAGTTKKKNRFLHGSEGKGRFKAFAFGRVVDWKICYQDGNEFKQFTISMVCNAMREVRISSVEPASEKRTGVKCTISELNKAYEFLHSDNIIQSLSELFSTYLKNYPDVQIVLPLGKLDPSVAIASSKPIPIDNIVADGVSYTAELEIIEWKNSADRVVYLCNEFGLPLSQIDIRVHAPGFHFSVYLKSAYISKLAHNGELGLADMDPVLTATMGTIKEAVKNFYRETGSQKAKSVVERWKDEKIYPYAAEPQNLTEKIERDVFDIVAVRVNDLLPDFDIVQAKSIKLQLRMLRQAIENSPEELQVILTEVLDLPEKKQKEFAELLRETTLTAVISASKVVADRLKFLTGLEALLYDDDLKKNLKERTQLHRLLAENTWIFGEEFYLSASDQSLTEVLRKHLKAKNINLIVDEPVRRIDGSVGIVDLMLTRGIPCHRENELEHLVVELKRPKVPIGPDGLAQIKSYAFAVIKDERFRSIDTRWTFWALSNELDESVKQEASQANRPAGMVHQSGDKRLTIWVKEWSEVLHSNRQRLKLFQHSLELSADRSSSLEFLRETYSHVLGSFRGALEAE